jgi:hypothetical protein
MTDKPVFTDQFYIDKFMEIQQQNIVLYKSLLKIKENPVTSEVVYRELGSNIFDIIKDGPA